MPDWSRSGVAIALSLPIPMSVESVKMRSPPHPIPESAPPLMPPPRSSYPSSVTLRKLLPFLDFRTLVYGAIAVFFIIEIPLEDIARLKPKLKNL
jgi:hypothetical protein